MLMTGAELVDAHVHLTFATGGASPAPSGSREIQEVYLREQAAAGVTLVRDCGAVPGSVPPPVGPGFPTVISCGPLLAPEGPFLAARRTPVAPARLIEAAVARIQAGATWVKLLADAPGADGNMLAASPTYRLELVAALCDAVHAAGGRVAAHVTGPSASQVVATGVDSIEHGGWLTPEAVGRLGARGGAWTPTLSTVLARFQPLIDSGQPLASFLQRHLDGLSTTLSGALAAGVVVLAGTDERAHGSVLDEAEQLHSFGLSESEALAAASTAARAFLNAD
jgi:imidazolonepropionase-like amidohydrolase